MIRPDCVFVIRYDPYSIKSLNLGFYQETTIREKFQGAKILSVPKDAEISDLVGNVIVEIQPDVVVFDFSFLEWCIPYAKNEKSVFKDFHGYTSVYLLTDALDQYSVKIDQELSDATNYFGMISEQLLTLSNPEFRSKDQPFILPVTYGGSFPKSSSKYISVSGLCQAMHDMSKMGYPKNTKAWFTAPDNSSAHIMLAAIEHFKSTGTSFLISYSRSANNTLGQIKVLKELDRQWEEVVDFFGGEKSFHEELRYLVNHDHSVFVYPLIQSSVTLVSKFANLADQGVVSISLGRAAFKYKYGLLSCFPDRIKKAKGAFLDLCNTGEIAVMGYLPLGEFIDFNRE